MPLPSDLSHLFFLVNLRIFYEEYKKRRLASKSLVYSWRIRCYYATQNCSEIIFKTGDLHLNVVLWVGKDNVTLINPQQT